MKKALKRKKQVVSHVVNGLRVEGSHNGVSGNLSDVSGNLSDVSGNLSGVSGDLSGVSGNLSGVSGDLSDCEITEEERAKGVRISDLIDSETVQ